MSFRPLEGRIKFIHQILIMKYFEHIEFDCSVVHVIEVVEDRKTILRQRPAESASVHALSSLLAKWFLG